MNKANISDWFISLVVLKSSYCKLSMNIEKCCFTQYKQNICKYIDVIRLTLNLHIGSTTRNPRHGTTTIYMTRKSMYTYPSMQSLLRTKACIYQAAYGLASSLAMSWPLPGMFPGLLQLLYSVLGIAWWLSIAVPSPVAAIFTTPSSTCSLGVVREDTAQALTITMARRNKGRSFIVQLDGKP